MVNWGELEGRVRMPDKTTTRGGGMKGNLGEGKESNDTDIHQREGTGR